MTTELYIENIPADLTADLSTLLTFAIDDVKDFSSRSTTWSKTVVLPGTAANNKLFGHIFQVGQSNSYDAGLGNMNYNFNPAKSSSCLVFQDNIQTFKGVLRLLEIIIDKGLIEYEVAMWGELFGLNVALSSKLLENLDFSAYDIVFNDTHIIDSWDNPPGSGVYFPLIDYGTYSVVKHDWDIRTFRPALYVREYIDKMITNAGFRWVSPLLDSARFKSLVIPVNTKKLLKSSDFTFYMDADAHTYDGVSDPLSLVPFANTVLLVGFTANIDFTQFTATMPVTGAFVANVTGNYIKTLGSTIVKFTLYKNGVEMAHQSFGGGTTTGTFNITLTANSFITTGDIIWVEFDGPSTVDIDLTNGFLQVQQTALIEIDPGDMIEMNRTIPKNIRQIDFLVSIVKLFNLYVYEDKFDKNLIYLTPYIDFYSTDSADSIDWTYKLNRDKPLRVKPMSELNAKIYQFKYKGDTDYHNDLYKKRYNEGYGDYTFDSAFEFAQQTQSFELIFSSTPLVGYSGEEKVYPTIWKLSGATEENIDSNIRILQTKKITGVASWDIKNGGSILNSVTDYGYAGHLDDPDAPDNDLNFGALKELFFVLAAGDLSKTQFNVYYSGYMAELTDKDSKLLTGSFYLKPMDIFNLDFSKFIYLDGNIFRLNAIKDYNASKPDECSCELLRVVNLIY